MNSNDGKAILVTGAVGFIGFHVAKRLIKLGAFVIGYDNVNDYYCVDLKEARLSELRRVSDEVGGYFVFFRADLEDKVALGDVFDKHEPSVVIHMAAQAGVRYSLENPDIYAQSNLVGFMNILECCRHHDVSHLLYASSSSVYGSNEKLPFAVDDRVDNPISLYAATKKSNELMAYTYSHLFNLPATGMRFFTVYGPWGRPDMAPMLFMDAINAGEPIKVFNNGEMKRDFTYIDDVVSSVIALIDKSAALRADCASGTAYTRFSGKNAPYKIYNIGNSSPEKLLDFIALLEEFSDKKAIMEFLPLQPGDVPATYADIDDLVTDTGTKPETTLREGLMRFVKWWKENEQF